MYCTQCGAENTDDSRFCRACGHRLHPDGEKPATGETEAAAAPEQVSGLLARAFELLDAGRLDEAREVCLAALRLSPESVTGRSLLAVIYERKGDLDAAIRQMERVVEMNPDSVADRNRLADLRRRAGEGPVVTVPLPPAGGTAFLEGLKRPPVAASAGVLLIVLILLAVWLPGRGRQKETVIPPPSPQPTAAAPSPGSPSLFGETPASPVTPAPGGLFDGAGSPRQGATQAQRNETRSEARPEETSRSAPSAPRPTPQPPQPSQPATPATGNSNTGGTNLPPPAPPPPSAAPGPEPRIVITREPPSPPAGGTSAPQPPGPARPATSGRDLQLRAMELKAAGQREQAIATFRQAIEAYRREAAAGGGGFEAQQGIRTCLDEIQLLEAR